MDHRLVLRMLGMILRIEGVFLTLPLVVALVSREGDAPAFAIVMAVTMVLGHIMARIDVWP